MKENGIIWVLLATLALMTSFAVVRAAETQKKQDAAIVYICSTTSVLDKLVTTAAGQIQTAFADGQYARLVRQGIATQKNVDAARATLRQYKAAHIKLKHDAACFGPHTVTTPASTTTTTSGSGQP